ncbi:Allophanate hydrolase subunit 1 [Methylocella silvestris BL2]|uniref:Allophanate hydrolase subunit 1 n=1 Tax=Methylocella silvestris (strain DSM 15510 / CIP 108128 / LMG 27833 / NCIMB 13906 / BL2) TaxID=395965 RepID=B8ESL5_METSB|nr:allophanate hydrolase subunit 1 [Methylocella silvestris]ACK50350.1 Allophanate hydrolase subunit 1 [Methylocella silvestris BL2]
MTDAVAYPRFLLAGERALVVEFGETIDPAVNARVVALDAALGRAGLDGVVETVPTYRSLMIHYDPARIALGALRCAVSILIVQPAGVRAPRRWRVPVCYDAPFAEDLGDVAKSLGLSTGEVVALQSAAVYRVYMYGFAPGYIFLGGLPPALNISRRPAPRPPVPPGSLLIAAGQALIASIAMPTGWHQIGRTPVKIFDFDREPMVLAEIGDEIMFDPIDAARFVELSQSGAANASALQADGG